MRKFDIQDRIVLDEMVDTFTVEMHKNHDEAELMDKRTIITREYWDLLTDLERNKCIEIIEIPTLSY